MRNRNAVNKHDGSPNYVSEPFNAFSKGAGEGDNKTRQGT